VGLVSDTSAVVAVGRAGVAWRALIEPHMDEEVALPAIVYAELLGVALADSPKRARRWREGLDLLVRAIAVIRPSLGVPSAERTPSAWARVCECRHVLSARSVMGVPRTRSYTPAVATGMLHRPGPSHCRAASAGLRPAMLHPARHVRTPCRKTRREAG
jgi:hypothetical protein